MKDSCFPIVHFVVCSDSPGIQIMINYACVVLLSSAVKLHMTRKFLSCFSLAWHV